MKRMLCLLRTGVRVMLLCGIVVACGNENDLELPINCEWDLPVEPAGEIDEWTFPVTPGTPEWDQLGSTGELLQALQMPQDVLDTISTAGLLETCLNWPFLLDIIFGQGAQGGFELMYNKFNGFAELLARWDLIEVLISKYGRMGAEIPSLPLLESIDQGRFSIRHLALEMLIAQDVVVDNLTNAQEKELVRLSLKQTDMEQCHPQTFGNMNKEPTHILYAKLVVDELGESNREWLTTVITYGYLMSDDRYLYVVGHLTAKHGL